MRPLAFLLAVSAMLLSTGCISESEPNNSGYDRYSSPEDNNDGDDDDEDNDDYPACAEAPSGAGYWEDESEEGLHCNYLLDNSDDWAYYLNSSESACREASWAPYQEDGGSLRYWYNNGNEGCDWVISW